MLAVSGVIIVDAPPPVPANAAQFGKIAMVGELEDGPFNTATDLLTSSDQASTFGLFGFTYGSAKYRYASALKNGGTEPWNGNLWVQTAKLKWAAALMVRVDTSVGQVSITPRAYVQGTIKAPFALTVGQTFIVNANGAGNVTWTVAGVAATHKATAGTYNSFAGGEILTLTFNGGAATQVIFQASDTSLTLIIARINATFGVTVASNDTSQLRLTSTQIGSTSKVIIAASAVATTLGLTAATYTGTGDAADLSIATQAEVKAAIEAAIPLVKFTTGAAGFPRVVSKLSGTGTILIGSGTANGSLGFTAAASATAALAAAVSIPAGTRCSDGTTPVVTMQTTTVAAASTASTLIKVRPAVDDGTYAGASATTVTTLIDSPGDIEWGITNPILLTACLTATQLDSAYLTAIAATVGPGSDKTKRINGIISARQSNAIRAALKTNAVDASASGHYGRRGFLAPPNGTTAAACIQAAAPGVGAYRAEEVSYVAGGVLCTLQEMIDGGYNDGILASVDGQITRHPDALAASRWSTLTPGYNPGQFPEDPALRFDTAIFNGLESVAATWDLTTYAAFKTAGVMASEYDADTGIVFEQGCTAVDPAVDPARVDVSRKTLADFVGDSLSGILKIQAKRQGTTKRHENTITTMEGFLEQLKDDTIEKYNVSFTKDGLPTHVVMYTLAINPVQSDDVAIINLKVGPKSVELLKQ